jgi:hypothetical protein
VRHGLIVYIKIKKMGSSNGKCWENITKSKQIEFKNKVIMDFTTSLNKMVDSLPAEDPIFGLGRLQTPRDYNKQVQLSVVKINPEAEAYDGLFVTPIILYRELYHTYLSLNLKSQLKLDYLEHVVGCTTFVENFIDFKRNVFPLDLAINVNGNSGTTSISNFFTLIMQYARHNHSNVCVAWLGYKGHQILLFMYFHDKHATLMPWNPWGFDESKNQNAFYSEVVTALETEMKKFKKKFKTCHVQNITCPLLQNEQYYLHGFCTMWSLMMVGLFLISIREAGEDIIIDSTYINEIMLQLNNVMNSELKEVYILCMIRYLTNCMSTNWKRHVEYKKQQPIFYDNMTVQRLIKDEDVKWERCCRDKKASDFLFVYKSDGKLSQINVEKKLVYQVQDTLPQEKKRKSEEENEPRKQKQRV